MVSPAAVPVEAPAARTVIQAPTGGPAFVPLYRFEGTWDPATGALTFRTLESTSAGAAVETGLRTLEQALDWCGLAVDTDGTTGTGTPGTFELVTEPGTILTNEACFGGAYTGPFAIFYEEQGALCADVTVRSFRNRFIDRVYAQIDDVLPDTENVAPYRFPLGTGAQAPLDGTNPPSDATGLWFYGDLGLPDGRIGTPDPVRPDEITRQWIFRYDGTPFTFRGTLLAAFTEDCATDEDDNCNGRVNELCGQYPLGATCVENLDCDSGSCDAATFRCGPTTCESGVRDGLETDVDCGGFCPPCALGQSCVRNADCVSGACNGGTCFAQPWPVSNSVVITEVMVDPVGFDSNREWFEVYNPGSVARQLQGCVFQDDRSPQERFTVESSLIIPAGGYVVLGAGNDLSIHGGGFDGGFPVAYTYRGMTFGNGNNDEVRLTCGENFIDRYAYIAASQQTGVAENLSSTILISGASNNPDNRCATQAGPGSAGATGRGTPGGLNTSCFASAPNPSQVGQVLVTEVMGYEPSGETNFEWFELFNATSTQFDLGGCIIREDNALATLTVPFGTLINPGQYLVFAAQSSLDGVGVNVTYNRSTSVQLNNTVDSVRLDCGGTIISRLNYSVAAMGLARGQSAQLPAAVVAGGYTDEAAMNAAIAQACASPLTPTSRYGTRRFQGTPGQANVGCDPVPMPPDVCFVTPVDQTAEVSGGTVPVELRVEIPGVTGASTGNDFVPGGLNVVQLGTVAPGADPRLVATTLVQVENAAAVPGWVAPVATPALDAFQASLATPASAGASYSVFGRVSRDGGATWTWCDTVQGPRGTFSPAQQATITSGATAAPAVSFCSFATFGVTPFFSGFIAGLRVPFIATVSSSPAAVANLAEMRCGVSVVGGADGPIGGFTFGPPIPPQGADTDAGFAAFWGAVCPAPAGLSGTFGYAMQARLAGGAWQTCLEFDSGDPIARTLTLAPPAITLLPIPGAGLTTAQTEQSVSLEAEITEALFLLIFQDPDFGTPFPATAPAGTRVQFGLSTVAGGPYTWTDVTPGGLSGTSYPVSTSFQSATPGEHFYAWRVSGDNGATWEVTEQTLGGLPLRIVVEAPATTCHPVINEFRTRGPGGPGDEFIELFNPCPDAISLNGWTLEQANGSQTVRNQKVVFDSSHVIAAGGYLVVRHPTGYTGSTAGTVAYNGTSAGGMGDDGAIGLFFQDQRRDSVTYGEITNPSGAAAAMTEGTAIAGALGQDAETRSVGRLGNGRDEDDNLRDFSVLTFPSPGAENCQVMINEFATRGPDGATDEFIELYNACSTPANVAGWQIRYRSASGTSDTSVSVFPAGSSIPANGYFLWVHSSFSGDKTGWPTSGSGMADNGGLGLYTNTAANGGLLVDAVGFGTGSNIYYDLGGGPTVTLTAANVSNGLTSVARIPNGWRPFSATTAFQRQARTPALFNGL
jgi:hypothetical protein